MEEEKHSAELPREIGYTRDLFQNFGIIGAGAWGTALACAIARSAGSVIVYSIEDEVVEEINSKHTNNKYLINTPLPPQIKATKNIRDLLEQEVIIIAVPSYTFLDIIRELKNSNLSKNVVLLIATKGLANNPARLFSRVLEKELPHNKYAFIAGPNFAREVALEFYSAATIAAKDLALALKLAKSITSSSFVVDATDDIITLQVAGIVKNIIAIQSGINEANNAGENAKAALITNALQEILLISKALGGKEDTLIRAGVVGDLVLTSYSKTSRNTKFGYEFAKSQNKKEFLSNYPSLVEGKESINVLIELVKSCNIDLQEIPIINSIFNFLKGQ